MNPLEQAKALCWNNRQKQKLTVTIPTEVIQECTYDVAATGNTAANSGKLPSTVRQWTTEFTPFLDNIPGFVCLKPATENLSDYQLRQIYGLIARSLGQLNDRYGIMFDVKDQGMDYTKEAIPVSKTKASTGFHTDSTAKEYSPDIIGLLCIQPGHKGGESLLANAADLYCWMLEKYPEYIPVLSQPVIRDVITPGTTSTKETIRENKFPVFGFDNKGLKFRYMRYWINTGYEKSETPKPPTLDIALDCIDEFLANKKNICEFNLSRGEILFANNRFLCHSRKAFTDASAQSKKRTLVRAWINKI